MKSKSRLKKKLDKGITLISLIITIIILIILSAVVIGSIQDRDIVNMAVEEGIMYEVNEILEHLEMVKVGVIEAKREMKIDGYIEVVQRPGIIPYEVTRSGKSRRRKCVYNNR